jgi:serine/threonine-protein kinase
MSYCVNQDCPNPDNLAAIELCQACGSRLLLNERYRALKVLGKGGFGATFLARNTQLPGEPFCVIKQLRPASNAPQIVQMARDLFRREAKTLGKIGSHPQIPALLDYFETASEFYLVQEYVSGLTLQREVREFGPFSEEGVKQFLSEILPILQYVHTHQVIHRDIKPANVIRREQDRQLVLIDFGAVKDKVNPNATSVSEQTTLTAYAVGTPGYAPPEQMAMRPVYASDIYALGVTCVFLLSSKTPKDLNYDPTTGEILWQQHCRVSEPFAEVLRKMLEVSVRHRYQSADEVLRALDLVPYMESLAQGMVSVPTPGRDRPSAPSPVIDPIHAGSPAARMAMGIRSRRQQHRNFEPTPSQGLSRPATSSREPNTIGMVRNSGGSQENSGALSLSPNQLKRSRLSESDLKAFYSKGKRDFTCCDLSHLNLQRQNLSGANFHDTNLHKTNFLNAELSNADFGRANLSQATLRETNLRRAYLSYADLQGADLRGADLSYAYLSHANLRGANLCGANLTGAKVTFEQLSLAKINWGTIGTNGKRSIFGRKAR